MIRGSCRRLHKLSVCVVGRKADNIKTKRPCGTFPTNTYKYTLLDSFLFKQSTSINNIALVSLSPQVKKKDYATGFLSDLNTETEQRSTVQFQPIFCCIFWIISCAFVSSLAGPATYYFEATSISKIYPISPVATRGHVMLLQSQTVDLVQWIFMWDMLIM